AIYAQGAGVEDFFLSIRVPILLLFGTAFMFLMKKIFALYSKQRNLIKSETALKNAFALRSESSKPFFFISGTGDLDNPQSMAALLLSVRFFSTEESLEKTAFFTAGPMLYHSFGAFFDNNNNSFSGKNLSYCPTSETVFSTFTDCCTSESKPVATTFSGVSGKEMLLVSEGTHFFKGYGIAETSSISQIPFFMISVDSVFPGEEQFVTPFLKGSNPDRDNMFFFMDILKIMVFATMAIIAIFSIYEAVSGDDTPMNILRTIITGHYE
ncbi:MAG: DUF6754 domain-containing protein, partial [bacterium]